MALLKVAAFTPVTVCVEVNLAEITGVLIVLLRSRAWHISMRWVPRVVGRDVGWPEG
jgi:hypothetical protein